MTAADSRGLGRSAWALFAGFLVAAVLSLGTDVVLHATGVFPPWGEPMADALFVVALAYRLLYTVLSGYVTARLAPRAPMAHVLVGGAIGTVLATLGVVATWDKGPEFGPKWYPLLLVVTAIPSVWAGGRLAIVLGHVRVGLRHTTLVALILLAGCSRESSPTGTGSTSRDPGIPRLEYGADLTEAERKFGPSPRPNPKVTYQPDVVVPKDGAAAIQAAPTNGMTWTLKPDAAGVSDLAPGKILFATGRAVGRVLALQRKPSGVEVTLGPIELTDVIKDAELSVNEPVDLDRALVYVAPDMPTDVPQAQAALPSKGFVPAVWSGDTAPWRPIATSPPVTKHNFTAKPYAGPTGIGVNITSDAGGVKLISEAVLYLNSPRLQFDLEIKGGKVRRAEVVLNGAAGILVRFQVASAGGVNGNISESIPVPVDFSLPISGLGVPFAVTVRQHFVINTVFTAPGGLDATGHYAFTGPFHMGYRDGQFTTGGPTGFSAKRNLVDSLTGVSIGANGLAISYQAKVIVGIGAFGFVTGPYFGMNATYTAARGSGIGLVICNQESVDLSLVGGVGYAMPRVVVSAINSLLRALNAGEIKGEGGFQAPALPVVKKSWVRPAVKACMPD